MASKLKTLGAALAALAALAPVAACSSSEKPAGTTPSSSTTIKPLDVQLPSPYDTTKTLTIEYADYPPFISVPESGDKSSPIGLDVDLAEAIAAKLGLTLTYMDTAFANLIPNITTGKADMAVGDSTDLPARQAQVDIIDYMYDGESVLVKAGNPKNLSPDNLCGSTVAATAGTTYITMELPAASQKCTDAGKSAITISGLPTNAAAITALRSGRADAVISSAITNGYTVSTTNGELETASDAYNKVNIGFFTKKDSGLAQAVKLALQSLIDDGTYTSILTKYGVADLGLTCALINMQQSSCQPTK